MSNWSALSRRVTERLGLQTPPVAMTFVDGGGPGTTAPAFDGPMSAPTEDGRSGRVPASCVFWTKGTTSTFSTIGEDHGNCSVGRWVHGFAALDEIAGAGDVATLFASGWVTSDDVSRVQVVAGIELSDKPQCQIVAKAKAGQAALSMGCALSRERTGMPEGELTCAIPAADLESVIERLHAVVAADEAVQSYASADRSRFEAS